MKCLRLLPAMCIALAIGAAVAPARADDGQPANANPKTVEVYKQGKQYVVAIYRPDGSQTLALVDAPHVKPAGNGASGPDLADLMKNGKVTYAIDIAPGGTPMGSSIAKTSPKLPLAKSANTSAKPGKGKSAKLTRKEIAALKRFKARVVAMDEAVNTMGKAVNHASAPAAANTAPAK